MLKALGAGNNNNNEFLAAAVKESLQEVDPLVKALRAAAAEMGEGEKRLVFAGAVNFRQLRSNCHGMDGNGLASQVAPPLAGSARVTGDREILVKILLNGLSGPIDDKNYSEVMPALSANKDEYIASVATFIRNSFGNKARAISPWVVAKVRAEVAGRGKPWTLKELDQLHKMNK